METPNICIATEHASCNCCYAANYEHSHPSARFGRVDRIFEIRIGNMVNRVCPDCLRKLATTALTMLTGQSAEFISLKAPEPDETIRILTRDCNGKRDTLEFKNEHAVYQWADEVMTEEDEILMITQGNRTIYSGLQANPTMALTAEDLTGFFG